MATKEKKMDDLSVSLFCRNMAMMLAAGTQPDEALAMLGEDASGDMVFAAAAAEMAAAMQQGSTFAAAAQSALPAYAAGMIGAGEKAGRTEQVLDRLADYYEREDAMQQRLRGALVYPLVLLLLMCVVLGFLVWKVVPVFVGVYESLAGSLAGSSYAYVAASRIFSWAALAATLVVCAVLLIGMAMAKTPNGKARLAGWLEKLPLTAAAARQLAASRLTDTLATFTASGLDPDSAMQEAAKGVTHGALRTSVTRCNQQMAGGASLAQAMNEEKIFAPLYGRMLQSGSRSGKLDMTLAKLAEITGRDAENAIYGVIEGIEPLLTAFLTLAVGITLLAAMLPLIGILSSIG
ncbi:MAG: type II secretion system F family protein [Faecalibacterium sp.]|jgi:type IV pilus assembly protein PilC|nr:type II secretion system F family protein [Faecalibacterium sp.]